MAISHRMATPLSLLAFTSSIILITLLFAYIAFVTQTQAFPESFIHLWNRWDSGYYLTIAEHGYGAEEWRRRLIAFLPFYPLLIKGLAYLFDNYLLSGLFIANLAYVIGVFYLYRLTSLDYGHDIAFKSAVAFSFFPTAFFLHAPYSESLFIALVIASFYYARRERWFLCSALAMLAGGTRITGLALIFAMPLEYWLCVRAWRRQALWLLLIPMGFIGYLAINAEVYGNPLAFLEMQQAYWHNVEGIPWLKGLADAFHRARYAPHEQRILLGWFQLAFAALGWLVTILAMKLRSTYAIYAAATWAIATFPSYWASLPRYGLALFPMFILLALTKKISIISIAVFASLLLQSWLILRFVQGQWAF